MKKMPELKLCMNCKWSKPDVPSSWSNQCFNPFVIMSNCWALDNNNEGMPRGVDCSGERRGGFFAKCGQKGKQYVEK